MVPIMPITDGLADQLLKPLLGLCMGYKLDVWKYTLCMGAFTRQEMVVQASPEFYSIGVNQRLDPDQIATIRAQLEDPTKVTE